MAILVVGGDSVDAITERANAGGRGYVEHWSGRKTRDQMLSLIHILYLISHRNIDI